MTLQEVLVLHVLIIEKGHVKTLTSRTQKYLPVFSISPRAPKFL